jgi:hypothetical protein
MINPNKGLTQPYNKKYNGSVVAFLIALYGKDMSRYNEDQLRRLICIDSWFTGVYKHGGRYADVNYTWFKRLGMHDVLRPITDKFEEKDFIEQIKKEKLNRKFEVNEEGQIV